MSKQLTQSNSDNWLHPPCSIHEIWASTARFSVFPSFLVNSPYFLVFNCSIACFCTCLHSTLSTHVCISSIHNTWGTIQRCNQLIWYWNWNILYCENLFSQIHGKNQMQLCQGCSILQFAMYSQCNINQVPSWWQSPCFSWKCIFK